MSYLRRTLGYVLLLACVLLATPAAFAQNHSIDRAEAPPESAYMMRLADTWKIGEGLAENALLISLQGLANQGAPRLYFIYPPDWTFTFTESVYDFYRDTHGISFTELESAEQALEQFHQHAEGYVVWDKAVRNSLTVAFTAAGLENAIVVSEDQIPMARQQGLEEIADFRGTFNDWTDYELYQWAYDRYWDRTSKDYIIWMGGIWNQAMEPGVADWGMYQNAFFTDLSTNPADTLEYRMADRLMGEMNDLGLVMGWHSYKKDTEGQHISLLSSNGLRMEHLNALPNMSFSAQIPTTPGFAFENNHNVPPDTTLEPEKKVYIATVQTDMLGLGAWLDSDRGQIPYSWEVNVNWGWMAPALLQYFYQNSTPSDYFIGSLSGPGYLYPKAFPPDLLPRMIHVADTLAQKLDLRVYEIMDYSEGNRLMGNLDLPKRVVDAYYEGISNPIGFVNGYGPAQTFTIRDGVPFMSYDYYLSENRPADQAAADLKELAQLNPKRPYFLLMHVRQWSSIGRVRDILDRLGPEFELVPLDVFMKLAAGEPTFKTRYRNEYSKTREDVLNK